MPEKEFTEKLGITIINSTRIKDEG